MGAGMTNALAWTTGANCENAPVMGSGSMKAGEDDPTDGNGVNFPVIGAGVKTVEIENPGVGSENVPVIGEGVTVTDDTQT